MGQALSDPKCPGSRECESDDCSAQQYGHRPSSMLDALGLQQTTIAEPANITRCLPFLTTNEHTLVNVVLACYIMYLNENRGPT
jgi:hypothetical protein